MFWDAIRALRNTGVDLHSPVNCAGIDPSTYQVADRGPFDPTWVILPPPYSSPVSMGTLRSRIRRGYWAPLDCPQGIVLASRIPAGRAPRYIPGPHRVSFGPSQPFRIERLPIPECVSRPSHNLPHHRNRVIEGRASPKLYPASDYDGVGKSKEKTPSLPVYCNVLSVAQCKAMQKENWNPPAEGEFQVTHDPHPLFAITDRENGTGGTAKNARTCTLVVRDYGHRASAPDEEDELGLDEHNPPQRDFDSCFDLNRSRGEPRHDRLGSAYYAPARDPAEENRGGTASALTPGSTAARNLGPIQLRLRDYSPEPSRDPMTYGTEHFRTYPPRRGFAYRIQRPIRMQGPSMYQRAARFMHRAADSVVTSARSRGIPLPRFFGRTWRQ